MVDNSSREIAGVDKVWQDTVLVEQCTVTYVNPLIVYCNNNVACVSSWFTSTDCFKIRKAFKFNNLYVQQYDNLWIYRYV